MFVSPFALKYKINWEHAKLSENLHCFVANPKKKNNELDKTSNINKLAANLLVSKLGQIWQYFKIYFVEQFP